MARPNGVDALLLRNGASYLLLRDGSGALDLRDSRGIGSSISGGTFSRGRWRKMVEEEERQRQAARDERERERTRRIEAKRKARADAEAAFEEQAKARRDKIIADLKASDEQLLIASLRHLAAPNPGFAAPRLFTAAPQKQKPQPAPAAEREPWRDLYEALLDTPTARRLLGKKQK